MKRGTADVPRAPCRHRPAGFAAARRARARFNAAAITGWRCVRSWALVSIPVGCRAETLSLRASRAARAAKRLRAAAASSRVHSRSADLRSMQSTGHGAMHNSQPEHSDGRTECMRFCAPRMASIGQACMHNVQPMQRVSSMTATSSGPGCPHSGLTGFTARPVSPDSAATTASPPGGHRSMSAAPSAIASAYGRQLLYPQRLHCVCGSTASRRKASGEVSAFTSGILPFRPKGVPGDVPRLRQRRPRAQCAEFPACTLDSQ